MMEVNFVDVCRRGLKFNAGCSDEAECQTASEIYWGLEEWIECRMHRLEVEGWEDKRNRGRIPNTFT